MSRVVVLVLLMAGCVQPVALPTGASTAPTLPPDAALAGDASSASDQMVSPPDSADVEPMPAFPDGSPMDGGLEHDGSTVLDAETIDPDATPDAASAPDAAPAPTPTPVRYPADQIHSPITPFTRAAMAEIAAIEGNHDDQVFMKIGASSTVSRRTLHCFAGENVDLGDAEALQPTLDYFLAGDAAGSTPFDRETIAARIGHSAGWAIDGDPSPIQEEIAAIGPRLAIVHYGTNDMGLVGPYRDGLVYFYGRMMLLIEGLVDQGIVPILTGITRRGDNARANRWVHTFNAAIRGMAQGWQVPFIDLHLAVDHLDRHGLAGDGLHLNGYGPGACLLTEEGLAYGYNVRNLVVLESLDRVRRSLFTDEITLDDPVPAMAGRGTSAAPFDIETLPFADTRNTALSAQSDFDVYACDDADESGPEYVYRFHTDREIRLRAVVLDRDGVDIDLHVLSGDARDGDCLGRGHHDVAFTATPGTYSFVLDSFVNRAGEVLAGPYLFLLVECDDDDPDCD